MLGARLDRWGCSSNGRAPALHAGGTGIDTLLLHLFLRAEPNALNLCANSLRCMSLVLATIKKMMCYQGKKHANFMHVRVYACTCAGLGVSRHVRACFKSENAGMSSQRCSDGVVGYHVCLTRRRSRVRVSVRISFCSWRFLGRIRVAAAIPGLYITVL